MSSAARSVQVFGLYLLLVGLVALAVPNTLFGIFGVPPTDEPWIRILGVVVLVLGGYYLVAARHDLAVMFRATVAGRLVAGAGLILIVSLWGYWPAVVFGIADVGSAIWTWIALRRSDQDPVNRPSAGAEPPKSAREPHAMGDVIA